LQETKAHPDIIDSSLLHPNGMTSFWSSAARKGYSGTATFSRCQPESVEHGIGIRKFDSEGRFVITNHGLFKLYNVYFPNGSSNSDRHQFKQEFLDRFLHHLFLDLQQDQRVIVLGDYNIAPDLTDVYDPVRLASVSGFLPEERAWFSRFLKLGFTDCYRYLHPDSKETYTWWSYLDGGRIQNKGWRIDHICISQNLIPFLRRCEILDEQSGSDHCPICIELE
jgi:exodeoxyribonuclease-3